MKEENEQYIVGMIVTKDVLSRAMFNNDNELTGYVIYNDGSIIIYSNPNKIKSVLLVSNTKYLIEFINGNPKVLTVYTL